MNGVLKIIFANWGVLGQRFFRRTFLLLLIVTIVGMLNRVFIEVQDVRDSTEQELNRLTDSLELNFIRSIWQFNDDAIDALLTSISIRPEVQFTRLETEISTYTSVAGIENVAVDVHECLRELTRDYREFVVSGSKLGSGVLTICYETPPFSTPILVAALKASIPDLIGVFITALIILLMVRLSIVGPIANLTTKISDNILLQDTDLRRLKIDRGDEIDVLAQELRSKTLTLYQEREIADTAFSGADYGIAVTDEDFMILRANYALKRMLSIESQSITNTHMSSYIPHHCFEGGANSTTFESAENVLIEVTIYDSKYGNEPPKYIFVFNDLTERQKTLENTIHAQKMNAIGTLSGGIAHDFNNLLAVIISQTELLKLTNSLPKAEVDGLDTILTAASRGAELTDKLLVFARKQRLKRRRIRVKEVFENVRILAEGSIKQSTIVENIQTNRVINVDEGYLDMALLNLILNARDAMPKGGVIKLLAQDYSVRAENYVQLSVIDSGTGIAEDIIKEVQNPFYTTKANGTGLGLPMVYGFAEQSDGFIEIESQLGKGTCVSIFLPVAQPQKVEAQENPVLTKPQNNLAGEADDRLNILIVDDDKDLGTVTRAMLNSLGHNAAHVCSLEQMKPRLDSGEHFDLILCDVILVGETGLDIYKYCQRSGIEIPFVFITGNMPKSMDAEILMTDHLAIIKKPFTRKTLIELFEKKVYPLIEHSDWSLK